MGSVEKKKSGGLAGIVAGDSSICLCSAEDESLIYRGYAIDDLAKYSNFEETLYLILRGHLPNRSEFKEYCSRLKMMRDIPVNLKAVIEQIPKNTNMMDVLRSAVSFLGHFEPENKEQDEFHVADRLASCMGSMLLYWYRLHQTERRPDLNTNEDSLAAHILHLINGRAVSEEHIRCMDVSLILYAEHEFNASTFTVRTIASTLSDFYSAICGGIGALRGPLHGGANEKAMELIQQFESPDDAEESILKMLANKELIMGFGHRVYTTKDPRSDIIKEWARRLCHEAGDIQTFDIAERIEEVMRREKNLFPNLDFYSALSYRSLNIPTQMFTPLFVMARIAGWSAHLLEQRKDNKLIRPISHYTGSPQLSWVPIEKR